MLTMFFEKLGSRRSGNDPDDTRYVFGDIVQTSDGSDSDDDNQHHTREQKLPTTKNLSRHLSPIGSD